MRGRLVGVVALVFFVGACGESEGSVDPASRVQPSTGSEVASSEVVSDDVVRPELRRGDEGPWVVELQRALTRHGFGVDDDGEFGPATEAAVKDFQTSNGLTCDGAVGPETWSALMGTSSSPPPPGPATTPPPRPTGSEVPAESTVDPLPVTESANFGAPADLGVLPGGTKSLATDINDSGVIVGFSYVGTLDQQAVWWPDPTAGPETLVGLIELRFEDQQSLAIEINDAGQVLVAATPQAFVVDPHSGFSIAILPPFEQHGFDVNDMNGRGQVVGDGIIEWPPCEDCEPNPITRGFIWDPSSGTTTILDPLDGATSSTATAINDRGQVVGSADGRPFIWNPSDATIRELERLPGDEWAYPFDLNDQGLTVGVSGSRAVLWDTATGDTRNLGTVLPDGGHSVANGVNEVGQVVLMAGGANWVLDLSSNQLTEAPGTTLGYAIAINDRGQAVGMSSERAALWSRIAD